MAIRWSSRATTLTRRGTSSAAVPSGSVSWTAAVKVSAAAVEVSAAAGEVSAAAGEVSAAAGEVSAAAVKVSAAAVKVSVAAGEVSTAVKVSAAAGEDSAAVVKISLFTSPHLHQYVYGVPTSAVLLTGAHQEQQEMTSAAALPLGEPRHTLVSCHHHRHDHYLSVSLPLAAKSYSCFRQQCVLMSA